ncbi:MAG: MBL fold metallo-hydrolase [Acidobacteriota bacterium]
MRIKFWGTRGSIPICEADSIRYGGNTTCVEVRTSDGELIVLDAGTGIRKLGLSLLEDPTFKHKGSIFITHTHWDHIQGFPFFTPAFMAKNHFVFYGQFKLYGRLEDSLKGQMEHIYFPVRLRDMGSRLEFVEIIEEEVQIGSARVVSRHLNHPQGVLGYRIEDGDNVFVFCTDTEHYLDRIDPKVVELAKGADVLVYDSQYTEEEYPQKIGWGHSTWRAGVDIARAADAKQLVLTHHDPQHNDAFIDGILARARKELPDTLAAYQDMTMTLEPKAKRGGQKRVKASGKKKTSELELRTSQGHLVVRAPSQAAAMASPGFSERVLAKLDKGLKGIVIDMGDVKEIDSPALGSLALIIKRVQKLRVPLVVARPSAFVREVLSITGFPEVLKIVEDHPAL